MHIKGSWRPLERGESRTNAHFPHFDLQCSDSVTILEDNNYKIIYEGVIFDFDNSQILNEPRVLDKAFGYYTYVLFDKNKYDIFVGTDRLGYSALYYAWEGGQFLFSSSPTLLKYALKTVTPNFEAWDEILTLGDIIGEKSVVCEISRARWGQKFLLTAESVDKIDIWSPETPPFVDRERYIRENNDLLAEAMALTKTSQREKFIFLTGGHDSRRLAIAARSIDLEVTCAKQVSIGIGSTDKDTLIAEDVAHCLKQPIIIQPMPSSSAHLNDALIKDFWIAYESNYHEWALPLLRHIPKGSLIYDGVIGDVTINGHYFVQYPSAVSKYADLDYMASLICGNQKTLLDPKLVATPLFERVRAELARYPDSPHRLTYYFLLNHTRRNISSWCLLDKLYDHTRSMPYMYNPLFVQSLSLEPKLHLDNWMQMECMKKMHPAAAAFPSTREKVPEQYIHYYRNEAKSRMESVLRNMRIGSDAKRYFPGLKRNLLAFEAMSRLGFGKYAKSSMWAASIVSRFSGYLDWLDDRKGPNFPVESELVEFLEKKLTK